MDYETHTGSCLRNEGTFREITKLTSTNNLRGNESTDAGCVECIHFSNLINISGNMIQYDTYQ
jgi:hypothetical protein